MLSFEGNKLYLNATGSMVDNDWLATHFGVFGLLELHESHLEEVNNKWEVAFASVCKALFTEPTSVSGTLDPSNNRWIDGLLKGQHANIPSMEDTNYDGLD